MSTEEKSLLVNFALGEAVALAMFMAVGGLIGYVKKRSKASAVMGLSTALVILLTVWLANTQSWLLGIFILTLLTLYLFVFFFERYLNTGRMFMPGGMIALVCLSSFIISFAALVLG